MYPIHALPIADPRAVVTLPTARFTVLTERLIRLEYSPSGHFEDRPSQAFWFRQQPVPDFEVCLSQDELQIETKALSLRYRLDSPFAPDTLSIEVRALGITWHFGDTDPQNLRGTFRTLDQTFGPIPLEPGLISRSGWALVDDSNALVFNEEDWLTAREAEPGFLDLYFFGYAHDYAACLREYSQVSGAVPLVPRYMLGNWWSRYWAYSQAELEGLMEEFRAYQVPLSVCIIDMDWHITKTGNTSTGWTGYTWNRQLFPNPEGFLQTLKSMGLHAALNLHPAEGIHPHEEQYPAMAEKLGIDPASQQPVPFDIADPIFTRAYFDLLHHPQEKNGIDFWWLDWQQGRMSRLPGLDPLWWLNHLHFHDLGRDGAKRKVIFSRWGGLGNHRYPIGFSGDTVVCWPALAFQPYFTATAANVNYGWWSHDIGGHMRGFEDAELYLRWVQFGVLSPILRLHSTNNPFHERRPWGFDAETYRLARQAMQLRHALIPYLYSLAWAYSQTNRPPVLPLYYDYPEAEEAYAFSGQYSFGPQLLAAPFTTKADPKTRLSRQVIWLPEGRWYDFFSGQAYAGDQVFAFHGALADVPLYARAGAIVPMGPMVGWGGVENPKEMVVKFFAGAAGQFTLYEDDGETEAYRQGKAAFTLLEQEGTNSRLVLRIGKTSGDTSCLPAGRTYHLLVHGINQPSAVTVLIDGQPVVCEPEYDLSTGLLSLHGLALNPAQSAEVIIAAQGELLLPLKDPRPLAVLHLLRAFDLETGTKYQLYQQLEAILADPSVLQTVEHSLCPSQRRALLEVVAGLGVTLESSSGVERLILWNQEENPAFRYSFSFDALHSKKKSQPPYRHGTVPRRLILPLQDIDSRAPWKLQASYDALVQWGYGRGWTGEEAA